MSKTERQRILMVAGLAFVFVGLFLTYLGLILEDVGTKALEFAAGAVGIIVGAWLFTRGYSGRAGKDASVHESDFQQASKRI